jgi:hypothetical protein
VVQIWVSNLYGDVGVPTMGIRQDFDVVRIDCRNELGLEDTVHSLVRFVLVPVHGVLG